MKILITGSNKIASFGTFVFPKTGSDESIFDTDDVAIKQILALASTNGIEITAKKKADILIQLNDHLVKNNTEVNTMSDTQKFEDIIVAGFEAETSDNEMFKQLFQAGCEYTDLKTTFTSIVEAKGLRLSPKDRAVKTTEFLEGYTPDATDVESHLAKVSALQDHLGCATTQAGASMRKWAKDNDITLPKVPKKTAPKMAPGFRGNQKIVADHALANKDITFDELVAFAAENVEKTSTGKDNSRAYAIGVWNAVIFAKAYASETVAEVEVELEEAA